MIIAQISDLHVVSDSRRLYDFVDSNEICARAIAVLNGLGTPVDCVLISGDTVNCGTQASYDMLERLLDGLRMPAFVIPGNHDQPERLRRMAGGRYHRATGPKMDYAIDEFPLRIMMLDSTVPGELSGLLTERQLEWIRDELSRNTRPTLVCVHHPPCLTGNAHMDPLRMRNGGELLACLKAFPHVVGLACGHTHRAIFLQTRGVRVFTAPALATAIETDFNDARGFFIPGMSGYLLHAYNGEGLTSFVEHLPTGSRYSFAHVNNCPKTGEV